MPGQTDLRELLATMRPGLVPGRFVFVTLPLDAGLSAALDPVMRFVEAEGITLILAEEQAQGLPAQFLCRMITLEVQSSLQAVGFLAAIATRLASAGIPVNPVSAFHHDHLFVPADRAEEALRILEVLSGEAAGR